MITNKLKNFSLAGLSINQFSVRMALILRRFSCRIPPDQFGFISCKSTFRGALALLSAGGLVLAATPVITVDFDQSGRQMSEVTESNYIPWVVTGVTSADTTLENVKITISKSGSAGTALATNWYKTGVQSPYYAKLVCDGIYVADGNSGGAIQLQFDNLPAGTHTLLTYHNNVDSPDAYTFSKVDVSVNGIKQETITPTTRATSTAEAATSFVSFTVAAGGRATILYTPSSSATFKNVLINGFALNVVNSAKQAQNPSPANLDDHAEATSGTLTLSWNAASGVSSHQVYFGTDSLALTTATTLSSYYQGSQTGTSFNASGLYIGNTYFWRVDEVDASGTVTLGNVWRFRIARLAFEGAEGYGRMARGGRGGQVVYVTNLNDSGTGSLRDAVENDIGPRTIVFNVAGVIALQSRLSLSSSYVTVAGQTAPGKGITIRAAPFGMSGGSDNIIRFLRVRLGAGQTYDGMGMAGSNFSILDHCSISWTIDEAFSSRNSKNVTLQRTLISEALNIAGHQNYPAGTAHGYAATIGGDIGSFHHNLLAHNEGRNWSMGGGLDGDGYYAGKLDIFNNLVYNWGGRATDGGANQVNFVNNYYKEGDATRLHRMLTANLEGKGQGSQSYYYSGNVLQAASGSLTCDGTNNECGRAYTIAETQVLDWTLWVNKPFFPSYAAIQTAKQAYKDVLSDVGMKMPVLDDHDTRIITETKNRTYTYTGSVSGLEGLPDDEDDVGGYESYPSVSWADSYDTDRDGLPNWWEKMFGLDTNSTSGDFSNANKDRDGTGYTELERFLEWLATPNYKFDGTESQVIDLSAFTKGYDNGTYSLVSVPSHVTASISGTKLMVALQSSFGGAAYITWKIMDSAGDTFTRRIGIRGDAAASVSAPTLTKCGAGSSSQSVFKDSAITDFCYTWTGATTVSVAGFPSGIGISIDNAAQKVNISGYAQDDLGAYPFTVVTVGGTSEVTKKGTIMIMESSTALNILSAPRIIPLITSDYIYVSGLHPNTELVITDMSGKHLLKRKVLGEFSGETQMDLRDYKAGVFLLMILDSGKRSVFKITKQ